MIRRLLATLAILMLATTVFAVKIDENSNPKDYSNDFMVQASSRGTPQVTEDFESGVPPAGWSVIDNTGGAGPFWGTIADCGESGNYTNGSGDAACCSSDIFGPAPFDTELITESYDFCAGSSSVLAAATNYQNFAAIDFFEIDYSVDGGGAWTNILSWNEDHGTFRGTPGEDIALDISGADGQPSVIFRYHYFQPASDWLWYVQVDDAVLESDGVIVPGVGSCSGDGGGAVPTTTGIGIALMVLLLGGSGAYFLRRK